MEHYQAGGHKPSHYRTPRLSSDGHFTEGFPSVRFTRTRYRITAWSGWIAFFLLLLAQASAR